MEITSDFVWQNVFLAAIVLMVFSLPKIYILFFWSMYRLKLYESLMKMSKNKIIGPPLKKMLPEWIIDKSEDDDFLMDVRSQEILGTTADLKIPLIEATSSLIVIGLCSFFLKFDGASSLLILIAFLLLLGSIVIGIYYILRYYRSAKPYLERHKPAEDQQKN